jgi:hypothetical protein
MLTPPLPFGGWLKLGGMVGCPGRVAAATGGLRPSAGNPLLTRAAASIRF